MSPSSTPVRASRPTGGGRVERATRLTAGAIVAIAVGGAVAAASIGVGAGLVAIARKIVTPARKRSDDVTIHGAELDGSTGVVTLRSTPDTRLVGDYSFWFDRGRGHARLGAIVSDDGRRITRVVTDVTGGDLATARSGRVGGWLYTSPADAGFETDDVIVTTPLGGAPAWLVPAEGGLEGPWMIGVHGRGVTRAETIRSLPVFHRASYTSLLVSYRNDGEAPRSVDGRYGLGDTEWEDVEGALAYAVDHGATSIVLMGWSMGGATVLQAVTRARLREFVAGVVLESPVVDWRTTLRFQGTEMRVPGVVQELVMRLLQSPRLSRVSGRATPIDFDRLDFARRADALDVPILLLHSDDDGFVPSTASHALAEARPDLVTFEVFDTARHTKLWNYDPERFDRVIADWLARLRPATVRTGRSGRP